MIETLTPQLTGEALYRKVRGGDSPRELVNRVDM